MEIPKGYTYKVFIVKHVYKDGKRTYRIECKCEFCKLNMGTNDNTDLKTINDALTNYINMPICKDCKGKIKHLEEMRDP